MLTVKYRNPEASTAEYYSKETQSFREMVLSLHNEREIVENSSNALYASIASILVIFITIVMIQTLTFANFIAIFRISSDESSIVNKVIFSCSMFAFGLFILFNYLLRLTVTSSKISDNNFSLELLSIYIVIPLFTAFALMKIMTYTFISANIIMNRPVKKGIRITFFFKNLFCGLNQGVIKENGLRYIYLFRIYSLLLVAIVSMILFIAYSTNSYLFSSDKISALLIYKDTTSSRSLITINGYLILTIIYLFVLLFNFFNYPVFNKFKQVFDSIFTLYDSKISFNTSLNHETCEKEGLESRFTTYYTNFDTQSELYYITLYHENFNHMVYSEVYYVNLFRN
jgi:hypothetical protein